MKKNSIKLFIWVLLILFPGKVFSGFPATTREKFEALHGTEAEKKPFSEIVPPPCVGNQLDHRFLEVPDKGRSGPLMLASKKEWQDRLKSRKGKPTFVPLRPLDPTLDLVISIPGIGMNFQDEHALRGLDDTYQFIIAVSDQSRSMKENGKQLAEATVEFVQYWQKLRQSKGLPPSSTLRLIGHSLGAGISWITLGELVEKGWLSEDQTSLFKKVLYIGVEGPWRGGDLPFLLTFPGIKHAGKFLLTKLPLPFKRPTEGALSTVNRGSSMNALTSLQMPSFVTLQLVTVLGKMDTPKGFRHLEPVANWYSSELGAGEANLLWKFFRNDMKNLNSLESWVPHIATRKKGLKNLVFVLSCDRDFQDHSPELIRAAKESKNLEEFTTRYDSIIGKILDTFEGQHTDFMWTDKRFMPWLRKVLSER